MAHWAGEVEFDFVGGEEEGAFVATNKVVPQLTTLLARGDIESAVRLYEGSEASVAAMLLEGAAALSSASQKGLGQMFLAARDFSSAARVFEMSRNWSDAARTFEQGGDFSGAARCYELEGAGLKAAAAWERAGEFEKAHQLYAKTGPTEAQAAFFSRRQRFYESALVYQRLGNVRLEVEMLRMVPIEDPHRVPAVKRLGDLLERHGHVGQSAQLLVDTLQQVPAAGNDEELLLSLIRRMEVLGRHDHAARVRAFAEKQLTGRQGMAPGLPAPGAATPPAAAAPPPPAPPAAPSDPFSTLVDPFSSGSGQPPGAAVLPPDATSAGDPFGSSGAGAESRVDAYTQLKAIPIFGELALQDMKDLYRISEEVRFPPGAGIIEQGVKGAGLTVILAGAVQVVRVEPGNRIVPLAVLKAGSYVGELSLVDDAPTSARVVAHGPLHALYISRERFQQYLYTHEAAALRIYTLFTRTLADRLRQANQRS